MKAALLALAGVAVLVGTSSSSRAEDPKTYSVAMRDRWTAGGEIPPAK